MQPGMILRPDKDRMSAYFGDVSSNGSVGKTPCLHFSVSTMRGRDSLFSDLLPTVGSEYVFNGLLLVPTVERYKLPHVRGLIDPYIYSGIVLPGRELEWLITVSNGIDGLTTADGSFVECGPGLPVQLFDKKVTFVCVSRDQVSPSDDLTEQIAASRTTLGSGTLGIIGRCGDVFLVVKILLSTREYSTPVAAAPEKDSPRPRSRRAKT